MIWINNKINVHRSSKKILCLIDKIYVIIINQLTVYVMLTCIFVYIVDILFLWRLRDHTDFVKSPHSFFSRLTVEQFFPRKLRDIGVQIPASGSSREVKVEVVTRRDHVSGRVKLDPQLHRIIVSCRHRVSRSVIIFAGGGGGHRIVFVQFSHTKTIRPIVIRDHDTARYGAIVDSALKVDVGHDFRDRRRDATLRKCTILRATLRTRGHPLCSLRTTPTLTRNHPLLLS